MEGKIGFVILREGGRCPGRAYGEGSNGLDPMAADEETIVRAGAGYASIHTGVGVVMPPGMVGLIGGRSGLAKERSVVVPFMGTIDNGYRAELSVLLVNLGSQDFVVRRGDRIGQLLLFYTNQFVKVTETTAFPDEGEAGSKRGGKGFGSSGLAPLIQGDENIQNI